MPRHVVNICFSVPTWRREREAFVTYVDQTTDKVMVLVPERRGYAVWPWARWQLSFGLDARFALRAAFEDQVGALTNVLGELNIEYETVSWWRALWRKTYDRRIDAVTRFFTYAGVRVSKFYDAEGLYLTLLADGKNALRML